MNLTINKFPFLLLILMALACQTIMPVPTATPLVEPTQTNTPITTPTPILTPTEIPAPIGELSYSDRPDNHPDKYQIHVLYVVPNGFNDTERYFDGSIDESMELMNEWFAEQTSGRSFILDTYQGNLDITYIPLPVTEDEILEYAKNEYGKYDLEVDGTRFLSEAMEDYIYQMKEFPLKPRKLYVAYFEISQAYTCGWSQSGKGYLIAKVFPSAYSVRDKIDCIDYLWENVIAHEIIHLLGFPSSYSCFSHPDDDGAHVFDPETPDDILRGGVYSENPVLDPNHDDYYLIDKPCLDLADTPYLSP
ncbi:MAG: hypothetical protein H7Y59_19965 [Anaerolineales bacterium]|nr:hypothetical protein [Anaerolineales bacterium]